MVAFCQLCFKEMMMMMMMMTVSLFHYFELVNSFLQISQKLPSLNVR